MQHSRSPSPSMSTMTESALTYDEISMQRGRHFTKALQELKNLRPQLYSAAEYCESSYMYSEQKQVVLENLKDYSVKALVNAVDHLGTVASKLNELLDQQTSDISATELRVASAAQRLRTCQEYTDQEGLKQQSLSKAYSRHHKHYTFPDGDNDIPVPKTPAHETTPRKANGLPREIIRRAEAERSSSSPVSEGIKSATFNKLGTSNGAYSTPSPTSLDAGDSRDPSSPGGKPTSKASTTVDESVSLSALMSTTDGDRPHKELRPTASRSKSMFMSLLSRKKSFKNVPKS